MYLYIHISYYIMIYIYVRTLYTRFGSQTYHAQYYFRGSGGPGTFFAIGNAKILQRLGPLGSKSCNASWMY